MTADPQQKAEQMALESDGAVVAFRSFLQSSVEEQRAAQKRSVPEASAQRLANVEYVQALDNSLRAGCGLSLAYFLPKSPPGALGESEVRYFVGVGVGGDDDDDQPPRKRVCVKRSGVGPSQVRVACRVQRRKPPPTGASLVP